MFLAQSYGARVVVEQKAVREREKEAAAGAILQTINRAANVQVLEANQYCPGESGDPQHVYPAVVISLVRLSCARHVRAHVMCSYPQRKDVCGTCHVRTGLVLNQINLAPN